jgi:hypothetical protein
VRPPAVWLLIENLDRRAADQRGTGGRSYTLARPHRAAQNPALSAPLGLNLLAGYLMESKNLPIGHKKIYTNQQLANQMVLAGYLMGRCD